MTQSDLHLDILGTSLSITVDEDADYLAKILKQYQDAIENTQNATSLTDPLKIAILTGFLLSDEIHKLTVQASQAKLASTEKDGEAEQLTLDIIARIDKFLPAEKSAAESKDLFDE